MKQLLYQSLVEEVVGAVALEKLTDVRQPVAAILQRRDQLHGREVSPPDRLVYSFEWDGNSRLRAVKEAGAARLTASYNGAGLRVSKWDLWTGQHDYSWGPGGVLHDSSNNTVLTPGHGHRSNGVDRFCHADWIGSTRYLTDSTGNSSRPRRAPSDPKPEVDGGNRAA